MRMKSYFASTVEAALNLARQELGPDAMLVDSRRAAPDTRHLGEYEVVCALLPAKTPVPAGPELDNTAPGFRAPSLDKLSTEVSEIKRHMERMAATIARSAAGLANLRSNPELAECFAVLTNAEVESTLAHDLIAEIAERNSEGPTLRRNLAVEIGKSLKVDSRLGRAGAQHKIVALVGPPGSGKTTTLVKLAAQYGLKTRKPVQILTLDTFRVGAAEQLRSYAAILGVGFQVLETTVGLAQAIEEHRSKDLIFIDTPGFSRGETQEASDMARFLGTHPEIDVHLVLSASTRAADLRRIMAQYESFRPSKLIFSKTDETDVYGCILNLVARSGKPVSFLCGGQQIPEDLSEASKDDLVRMILGREYLQEGVNSAVAAA